MCNKQNCMQLFFQLQLLDIIGYDRCTSSWHQNFDAFDSDKLVVLSSVKLCQALSSFVKLGQGHDGPVQM